MKTFLVFVALISTSAWADGVNYTFPSSPLQTFGCPPISEPQGTVCYTGDYYGQTLGDRPVSANIHAQLVANTQNNDNGATDRITQ